MRGHVCAGTGINHLSGSVSTGISYQPFFRHDIHPPRDINPRRDVSLKQCISEKVVITKEGVSRGRALLGRGSRVDSISLRSLLLRQDRNHPTLAVNLAYNLTRLWNRDLLGLLETKLLLLDRLLLLRLLVDSIGRSASF